jgi:hypothetical protein
MNALTTVQHATAVQVYAAGARTAARPVQAYVYEDAPRWQSYEDERARAYTIWRATRPDAGYVAHRLGQELAGDDPGRKMLGQRAYAAQMARAATIEGPVGSVSLLV